MNRGLLIKTLFQSIIIAIAAIVYIKILKFKDIDVEINNPIKSKNTALGMVFVSIIMTAIYNRYFINIFPVNNILNFFILRLALSIPAIICIMINKEKVYSVGFTRKNLIKSFFLGLITGFIYFFTFNTKGVYVIINNLPRALNAMTYLFVYCLIIGFGEEFLYRGYLQTRLASVDGKIKGWILTSIIFSFMHFFQFTIVSKFGILEASMQCIYLLPISLVFGYIFMKTKNLIPVAILHTFVDWTPFVLNMFINYKR